MEEEAVEMPKVDISFAPTKAFVGAFGTDEAEKQRQKFMQPSWAQKMSVAQELPVLTKDEILAAMRPPPSNPLLTPQEQAQAEKVPSAAFVVVGGIFLAGAAFGLFVAWRAGMLNIATSM